MSPKRKRKPKRLPTAKDLARGHQLLRGLTIVRAFATHGRRTVAQLAELLPEHCERTIRRDVAVLVRLGWIEPAAGKFEWQLCDSELLQMLGWHDPAELAAGTAGGPPAVGVRFQNAWRPDWREPYPVGWPWTFAGTVGGPPAVVNPATDPESEFGPGSPGLSDAFNPETFFAACHRAAAAAGQHARDQRPDLVAAVLEKTRCAGRVCDLAHPTSITCPPDSCDLETGVRTNRCAEVLPERKNTTEKEPNT